MKSFHLLVAFVCLTVYIVGCQGNNECNCELCDTCKEETCRSNCCTTRPQCCNCCKTTDKPKPDCCKKTSDCCQKSCNDNNTSNPGSNTSVVVSPYQPVTNVNNNTANNNVSVTNLVNNQNVVNFSINVQSHIVNNVNVSPACCQNQSQILIPVPVTLPTVTPPKPDVTTTTTSVTQTTSTSPTKPCVTTVAPPPTTPCAGTTCQPQTKCCQVIIPCVGHTCNPYHRTCGDHCQGNYGYIPRDPCSGGCSRRNTWRRHSCWYNHCQDNQVDCSYCDDDFYMDQNDYFRCRGCYY